MYASANKLISLTQLNVCYAKIKSQDVSLVNRMVQHATSAIKIVILSNIKIILDAIVINGILRTTKCVKTVF